MLSKSRVKYIQSLAHKKFRDTSPEFMIEGPKMVAEFIRNRPDLINEVYALDTWIESAKVLLSPNLREKLEQVSEIELEKMSGLSTPNQVLALVRKMHLPEKPDLKNQITLVLDNIQDPGNLGTIIRTADWFGITQIICSPESAELYNPKVIQSTMGSILRVHVFYMEPASWLDQIGDLPVFCSALEGRNLFEIGPLKEGLVVIGNESKGVRTSIMERATQKITIPRFGGAESLNAAVAAGVILGQLVRS